MFLKILVSDIVEIQGYFTPMESNFCELAMLLDTNFKIAFDAPTNTLLFFLHNPKNYSNEIRKIFNTKFPFFPIDQSYFCFYANPSEVAPYNEYLSQDLPIIVKLYNEENKLLFNFFNFKNSFVEMPSLRDIIPFAEYFNDIKNNKNLQKVLSEFNLSK